MAKRNEPTKSDTTKTDQGDRGSNDDQPSFEQSLADIQQIVQKLEEGELGLEASLSEYERGIGLLRRCYQLLQEAEQKIEILTGFGESGEPQTQPFDASATWTSTKNSGQSK